MRLFFTLSCYLLGLPFLSGQVVEHVNGTVVTEKQYTDIQGNPYLFNGWRKGEVTLTGNEKFTGLNLKYDQVNDEVLYEGKGGNDYHFAKQVVAFSIVADDGESASYRNGFGAYEKLGNNAFYQVLYDGKVKFLRKEVKTIVERIVYGSANANKLVQRSERYFIKLEGKTLAEVKRDRKSLLAFLGPEKSGDLGAFIDREKLKFKSDEDVIKLLQYFEGM
ncbi:hypothetical protein [Parapedobacter koreensis]|nr:hypothetical protein [Parapedobacter koreensis]